ncbi:MAG: phosphate ABC transporter permease PstA [Acidimicrobiia bacterium]|nr:phosphate ABC transporter permease PstA [Acidimicrobiia bacterium]MYC44777.1 phosphate ABC transporter permease PstA [Acidimicrobiia bacterium]MYI19110.1 phosphate ABC transporter permease PstA [Acidimicrobiia bacterium]
MRLGRVFDDRTRRVVTSEVYRRSRDVRGGLFRVLLQIALLVALLVLAILLVDTVTDGWSILDGRLGDFLAGGLRSQSGDPELGVFQGIRGSLWIAVFVIVLAFPLGIGAAIYLEEYAPKSRLTSFIDLNIRNLAGVPSVVYGLLGLAIFVRGLKDLTGGQSVTAAGITLAVLVLPIVIITSAEAIRAVPQSLREAGYGAGATKWEVIRTQVLPYAAPGILTGTLLSLSRAIGEAAPLILVGAVTGFLGGQSGLVDVSQLQERFTALPIVITEWVQESGRDRGFAPAAAAAIVVMLVVVLLLNSAAILLRNHFEKKR